MTFQQKKDALSILGIILTQENEEIYRKLFAEILRQRRGAIGEPRVGESIRAFLERRNGVSESVENMDTSEWRIEMKNGVPMMFTSFQTE